MYKNKSSTGFNNICGQKIKELRLQLPEKTSQRKFADMLQIHGLDCFQPCILARAGSLNSI